MSINTREALNRLIAALEHHYDAAQSSSVLQEAALDNAEELLRNAFFTYDDALFTQHGVELPFEMLDEDYEDSDPVDEDLDDLDDEFYAGFTEEDYDFDEDD